MNRTDFEAARKWANTSRGEIAYVEKGEGSVALFVHGVLLNGYLWRESLDALSDVRRCIAIDLLAHGATKTAEDVDVSFPAQAEMIREFLDAFGIDQVDLVANDSGGGIAQIFAAEHPERIRTLTLTNCDVHDNYPPPALEPLVAAAKAGGLGPIGKGWLDDPDSLRAAFGVAYEHPERLDDELVQIYLGPIFATDEGTKKVGRMIGELDHDANVRIEPKLRQLQAPTLILWGTDDIFFDKKWAYWLKDTIPGARDVVEIEGAKLFFPEERPEILIEQLRNFWVSAPVPA